MSDLSVAEFVVSELPSPPARVLEVGCGTGALARAVANAGYDVLAIDPEAPAGPPFLRAKLEDLDDPGPFDAAVAARSLHHVEDLAAALDKLIGLLRPGGRLIVDDFGWDRLDEPTADWYHGQLRALHVAGRKEAPPPRDDLVADWDAEHEGLHTYAAMRAALDERFDERVFAWRPYLYRDLGTAASEGLEQSLIDAGAIQAVGFRYVGERRPRRARTSSRARAAGTPAASGTTPPAFSVRSRATSARSDSLAVTAPAPPPWTTAT